MELTDLDNLHLKRARALQKNGIDSVGDLLYLFPHRYIDRTRISQISELSGLGETANIAGRVTNIRETGHHRKKRLEVEIRDETGSAKGVWFRGSRYFRTLFKKGDLVAFFGTVRRYGRELSIAHPEVDQLNSRKEISGIRKIVPVYPSYKEFSSVRITSKLIHSWIRSVLDKTELPEFLPEKILNKNSWPARSRAFRMIHTPDSLQQSRDALERFKFEELFLFELGMIKVRMIHSRRKNGPVFSKTGNRTKRFVNQLIPFSLTEGQLSALGDIKSDLLSGRQMHRLIQGDVGAGKTVIAIVSILMALDNGYQAVFMAPTEILAEQHYHTLATYLAALDLDIRLLTGGQNNKLRTDILTAIEGGQCQIVIGTHAIIQESVLFHNLGLAVIDEQHRFGVKQRAEILEKGHSPHLLVMSATPIPRSLALSVYSDLDISVVKGLPAGRKPVRTAVRSDKKRDEIYAFLSQSINEGGQAYIVYPLVEESGALDLKDATLGYEKLKKRFPDAGIGLVHGRMKSDEKESVMQRFYKGEIQILVATTVIEVGVDVSNASIMIIEHAERFGLSQLHQLRGRIGRGSRQSYCILMTGDKISRSGRYRLNKMTETSDGFDIAEADLRLRGPGDFLGTRQSGLPEFRFADIMDDQLLLENARNEAMDILQKDRELAHEEHQRLKSVFDPYLRERSAYFGLG